MEITNSRRMMSIESSLESEKNIFEPKNCEQLLQEFYERVGSLPKGRLLDFDTKRNIPKITAPFSKNESDEDIEVILAQLITTNATPIMVDGKPHLLGRIETSELNSNIALFEEVDERFCIDEETPVFPGQDPFVCDQIEGFNIIGNVEVFQDENDQIGYRTVFRRYKQDFAELINKDGTIIEPFATSPNHMKDIRLIQLQSGKIGVFTRPQESDFGGRGKIGYLEIDSLAELEPALVEYMGTKDQETLIKGICTDEEWAGVNAAYPLEDGQILVLGHIARFKPKEINDSDPPVKDYFAMTFVYNPETKQASNQQIILTAESFPDIPNKNSQIGSVYFPGGLHFKEDGKCFVYGGVADASAGHAEIPNPCLAN